MAEDYNKLQLISSESELPKGRVISYSKDILELPEAFRKNIVVWELSKEKDKCCLILVNKQEHTGINVFSVKKKVQELGYNLKKIVITEDSVLSTLFERRLAEQNQKATKEDSAVVAYFENLLWDAVRESISDIHISNRSTGGFIKMRKHGEMFDYENGKSLSSNDVFSLCSVIYNVLAENRDVAFDAREYQPAAVNYTVGGEEVKLRYQSLPVYPGGFDIVLRVLPIGKDEEYTPLKSLGYTEQQVEDLLNISSRPVGSLIIAGTTGSGKSTTLKNLIMYINEQTEFKLKIYTIEDPPEYKIPRVSQIPVIRRKNADPNISAFEAPITACMRADPDIIMVGEVRDKVTGDLVKKAIQSGHQVLTTVHASSAVGILERLVDFGLSHSVLGSPEFLIGLIYQKLLQVLCPHCSLDFNQVLMEEDVSSENLAMAQRLSEVMDIKEHNIRIKGEGCEHCGGLKVVGRTVCAEIIIIDIEMLEYILRGNTIGLLKYWRSLSDGKIDSENMSGKTSMEHATQKMINGLVSPFDIESSFKPFLELYIGSDKKQHKKNHSVKEVKNNSKDLEDKLNKDGWDDIV